jgi:hypothetical protein
MDTPTPERLAKSATAIANAERMIEKQQEYIGGRRDAKLSVLHAESYLETLENTLRIMKAHRRLIS